MKISTKNILIIGSVSMAISITLASFGAHGLKSLNLAQKYIETFETGVRYQITHSLSIFAIGLLQLLCKTVQFKNQVYCFLAGILFFSFNCYLYAITNIKLFALLVPIGGVLFIVGWVTLALNIYKNLETQIIQ